MINHLNCEPGSRHPGGQTTNLASWHRELMSRSPLYPERAALSDCHEAVYTGEVTAFAGPPPLPSWEPANAADIAKIVPMSIANYNDNTFGVAGDKNVFEKPTMHIHLRSNGGWTSSLHGRRCKGREGRTREHEAMGYRHLIIARW